MVYRIVNTEKMRKLEFCVTKTGFTKDCYLFKVKKPIELP